MGERILIRFPATRGVIGLDGFVTACDDTGFCIGLCTVDCIRTGVCAKDGLAEVGVDGRAATVVMGGDVTGTVAGVTAAGVVVGAVLVCVLTVGNVPVVAGGMSYFCIWSM